MKKGFLFKLTILLVALVPMETGNAIQPALAEITKSLDISSVLAGYILSLPALATIIFAIVSGKLSVTIDKKKIVLIGLTFYTIGGVAGSFYPNIYWILACRFVLGIGAGLAIPLIMGLITEFFEGNERASMMGYSQALGNLGGGIVSIAAGYIALVSWRLNFLIYLFFIIVFVLVIKYLPKLRPSEKDVNHSRKEKGNLTIDVFIITLIGFAVFVLSMNLSINTVLYISAANIGNSSHAGIAVSLIYFCAFPGGLIFGQVFKLVKEHVLTIAIFLNVVAAFLVSNAQSILLIYIAMAIGGISVGFLIPGCSITVSKIVPKSHHSFAFGIFNAGMNVGILAAPPLIPILFNIVGTGNYPGFFRLITMLYAIVTAITAVYITVIQKKIVRGQIQEATVM